RMEKLGLRGDAPAPARGRRAAATPAGPRPAATRAGAPAPPPPSAIRWESRRVTLLRAVLEWSDKGSALDVVLDKLTSFGGRIDELSPTSVGAVFGLEPVEDAPRRAAHAAVGAEKGRGG